MKISKISSASHLVNLAENESGKVRFELHFKMEGEWFNFSLFYYYQSVEGDINTSKILVQRQFEHDYPGIVALESSLGAFAGANIVEKLYDMLNKIADNDINNHAHFGLSSSDYISN